MARARLGFLVFALAVCAPVIGCTNQAILEPQGDLGVSRSFTAEQRAEVVAAADEWRDATAGRVNLTVVDGDTLAPGEPRPGAEATTFLDGRVRIVLGKNVLAEAAPPDVFRAIVMHELGHAFGLEHFGHGLMAPGVGAQHVDADAVAHFCLIWTCAE